MAGHTEHDGSETAPENATTGKSRRGFASMDRSRQREIASKGGRAAHAKGTAHEWSSDEARTAGQKGGIAVSRDRVHMATIGREGGESRSRASRATRSGHPTNGSGVGAGVADRELVRSVSRDGVAQPGSSAGSPRDASREPSRSPVTGAPRPADPVA